MPKPGQYRVPLVAGLTAIGRDFLAGQVADKSIKLALSGSIHGAVVTRRDLTEIFVEALKSRFARNCAEDSLIDHYTSKLEDGSIVPVENRPSATADKSYSSGELFFRS